MMRNDHIHPGSLLLQTSKALYRSLPPCSLLLLHCVRRAHTLHKPASPGRADRQTTYQASASKPVDLLLTMLRSASQPKHDSNVLLFLARTFC